MQDDFNFLYLLVKGLIVLLNLTPALIDAVKKNWTMLKKSPTVSKQKKPRATRHRAKSKHRH